jgi:RHS repeat-associated protein
MLFDGGYAKADRINSTAYGYTLFYYNQDHQGNIREVMNASGNLQQKTNYYPFGGIIADICTEQNIQPYKYNGKELDLMHGLNTYDYGARQYYPILCRWDRVDPLCEKYYSVSPYAYCNNNPVKYIDSDGRIIVLAKDVS